MKHFVLDTNVLIHDPRAILSFADNEVVVPIFVIEEIDQFKKEASERGRNAREVARMLDGLRAEGARLSDGAPLPSGGRLRVASAARAVPTTLRESQIADHLILMVALDVRDYNKGEPTIFVTKDVNLRIRADSLGLTSMDFEGERIDIDELYSGMTELVTSGADVDTFYAQNTLPLPDATFKANQYVLLRDRDNPSHSALGRYDAGGKQLVALRKLRDGIWGIRPRNKEQHCALDLLLCDDIKLVTLIGKAGTGKTMLALATGLQKVVEEQVYSKLLVSRPIFPLGRDVGYLPGDIEEKLNPWMQPIYDNVEFLMGLSKTERKNGRSLSGADRSRVHRDRAADLHPRPVDPQPVHHRRRGAEPDAARGEDDHHPRRRGDEGGADRRPVPDRQPLRRRHVERPHHGRREVQGRADGRPRDALQGRALAARRARLQRPLGALATARPQICHA